MNQEHITVLLEALIDKYTMRSKAHKKLTNFFIEMILDSSLKDVDRMNEESRM